MVEDNIPDAENRSDDQVRPSVEIAAGIFLAAISIFALFWLFPRHIIAIDAANDVSPQFFPKLAAWAVLGLSLLLILTRVIQYKPSDNGLPGHSVVFEIVTSTIIAVLAVVGLLYFGFLITAPLIIFLGAIVCGFRNVWAIGLITIAVPLILDQAAWLIFTVDLP